ncbi:MAG: response regulator, partial [Pseudomonadota bacterium]
MAEDDGHERQKVLLVDDRPENLAALEATLEDPAIEVVKARSGEEALRFLLEHNVSLVLLDVQMPRMDGYEVARLMRSARRTRHVPILFITAYHSDEDAILKGYQSGAIDYIQKPVNPAMLRAKVSLLLEYDRQRQELRRARDRL